MLSLWNPFIPEKVNNSDNRMSHKTYFDRLFEDTFESAFQDLFRVPNGWGIESKKLEDGSLTVAIDVPGVQESDLTIEVDDGVVTVKGERKTATSSYSIRKSFGIPEGYDADNIKAELKDGVLNLTMVGKPLPVKEIKKIPILSGK